MLQTSARNRFIITQINKNRNIIYKLISRFEAYNNKLINCIIKQKISFKTKLNFNFKYLKIRLKRKIFIKNICVQNIVLITLIFFAKTN